MFEYLKPTYISRYIFVILYNHLWSSINFYYPNEVLDIDKNLKIIKSNVYTWKKIIDYNNII